MRYMYFLEEKNCPHIIYKKYIYLIDANTK